MRAGKLTETITVERFTKSVDDYGTETEAWTALATMRAQLIQSSTEEFIRAYGSTSDMIAIFKVRWRDLFTTEDRVVHKGQVYDLKEIKELGRREALELRCVAAGA